MVVKKTWERVRRVQGVDKTERLGKYRYTRYQDIYTGWFLFGVIPLYINRDRTRLSS